MFDSGRRTTTGRAGPAGPCYANLSTIRLATLCGSTLNVPSAILVLRASILLWSTGAEAPVNRARASSEIETSAASVREGAAAGVAPEDGRAGDVAPTRDVFMYASTILLPIFIDSP